MNPEGYIFQWAQIYVRNRDAVKKSILSMELKQPFINVKYRDKSTVFETAVSLEKAKFQPASTVITFNTSENFKVLLGSWKDLVAKKVTLVFINPLSAPDNKWFVAAHIHNEISDASSLKQGLKSMFDAVPSLTAGEVVKLANSGEF